MSKNDLSWPEDRVRAAAEDGWLLAYTVDSGKTHAYYSAFPHGPRHVDPFRTLRHLVQQAQRGSKLHLAALHAIGASRMPASAKDKGRGKKS
jgi:hypothetical protein